MLRIRQTLQIATAPALARLPTGGVQARSWRDVARSGNVDRAAHRLAAIAGIVGHAEWMSWSMWRFVVRAALAGGAVLLLAACAVDRHAALPEFMRARAGMPGPREPAPDVKQMVHDKLDAVFVAPSLPRDVRVSPPHRDPRGG